MSHGVISTVALRLAYPVFPRKGLLRTTAKYGPTPSTASSAVVSRALGWSAVRERRSTTTRHVRRLRTYEGRISRRLFTVGVAPIGRRSPLNATSLAGPLSVSCPWCSRRIRAAATAVTGGNGGASSSIASAVPSNSSYISGIEQPRGPCIPMRQHCCRSMSRFLLPHHHPPRNPEPHDTQIKPHIRAGKQHDKHKQMHRMPPEQRSGNHGYKTQQPQIR